MRKLIWLLSLLLIVLCISSVEPAPNKSAIGLDAWQEVPQNTVTKGATMDLSSRHSSALHIDIAGSGNSINHTGTKVEIQVSSNTSGDEDWTTLTDFVAMMSRSDTEPFNNNEPAGATVLEVTSTNYRHELDGTQWIFIEDDTVENSELCYKVSHVNNVSVTILDGLAHAHESGLVDYMFDSAATFTVAIPMEYNRARVIYDNTNDNNGSTVHVRTRLSESTTAAASSGQVITIE